MQRYHAIKLINARGLEIKCMQITQSRCQDRFYEFNNIVEILFE